MKDEALNSLFDAVADELLTKIKTGEAKPADLAVAVKFLKDNNIKYPIPELVENHVKAKKYLVYKDPKYKENLSDASKKTLEFQGGAMTEKEAREFEQDGLFELSLKLRSYDDKAKVENKKIKSLDYYREMCLEYLMFNF